MKKTVSFLPLIMVSVLLRAQIFQLGTSNIELNTTQISSMDIETADLDGDELPDIVIAGEAVRNVILFNDGNDSYFEDQNRLLPKKEPDSELAGQDSEDIAIADFDNDGDLDIIFVSEDTEFHELLINDGTGNFEFAEFEFEPSQGNAVAVLDLNGDNWPDIIVGNTGQNQVYLNNQDLSFMQAPDRWPVNTEGTQDFKFIDIDQDGDLDIVEGIDLGTNNFLINEGGFFTDESFRLPNVNLNLETRKVAIGDVNGDELEDIFICTVNFTGPSSLQNRLFVNEGDGTFSDQTLSSFPQYEEQSLDAVFMDFDLDDDLDLVTGGFFAPGNNYRAFENDGNGVYSEVTDQVFPSGFIMNDCIALKVDDLNSDGFDDIYFGGFGEPDDLLIYNQNSLSVKNQAGYIAKAYPNPAYDKVTIECAVSSVDRLLIIDSKGSSMARSYKLNGDSITIDVEDLAKGTYTIQAYIKDKPICSGKFVKSD